MSEHSLFFSYASYGVTRHIHKAEVGLIKATMTFHGLTNQNQPSTFPRLNN